MKNQLATLCDECESTLEDSLAILKGCDTSGFYCEHHKSCAVIVSIDGEIKYSQISGPITEDQSVHVMAEVMDGLMPEVTSTGMH